MPEWVGMANWQHAWGQGWKAGGGGNSRWSSVEGVWSLTSTLNCGNAAYTSSLTHGNWDTADKTQVLALRRRTPLSLTRLGLFSPCCNLRWSDWFNLCSARPPSPKFAYFHSHSPTFAHFCPHAPKFAHFHPHSPKFAHVHSHPPKFAHFHPPLLKFAHFHPPSLRFSHFLSDLPIFAHTRPNLPTPTETHPNSPKLTHPNPNTHKLAQTCAKTCPLLFQVKISCYKATSEMRL